MLKILIATAVFAAISGSAFAETKMDTTTFPSGKTFRGVTDKAKAQQCVVPDRLVVDTSTCTVLDNGVTRCANKCRDAKTGKFK